MIKIYLISIAFPTDALGAGIPISSARVGAMSVVFALKIR